MPRKVAPEEIPKDEEVLAKWPGAQLYYPGKVVDFDAVSKVYKIKFDNDSENDSLEVLQKHVSVSIESQTIVKIELFCVVELLFCPSWMDVLVRLFFPCHHGKGTPITGHQFPCRFFFAHLPPERGSHVCLHLSKV